MKNIYACALLTLSLTVRAADNPNEQFQRASQLYHEALYDASLAQLNELLLILPSNTSILYLKARCLQEMGKSTDMITVCKQLIAADPNHASAHQLLSIGYRLEGEFQKGWQEYLWRFTNHKQVSVAIDLTKLKGKRVAIHVEGKIGDNIHFVRYAKLLKERGATVVLQANMILFKLFGLCDYIDEIVSEPIPPVDILIWQQNLPLIFDTTLENIPTPIPYLRADRTLIEKWHQKLEHDSNLTIGICWQSSPDLFLEKKPYTRRSMPLSMLSSLSEITGVSLYSIQQIDGLDQLNTIPAHHTVHTFGAIDTEHGPFMDTAAIMKNLDLIITVDTSIAHLAGALGVPVWVMLPFACEWRWMNNRDDSPWYPTMRLFRQKNPGSWESVIREISSELKILVKKS